jgi:hypothetical protein
MRTGSHMLRRLFGEERARRGFTRLAMKLRRRRPVPLRSRLFRAPPARRSAMRRGRGVRAR